MAKTHKIRATHHVPEAITSQGKELAANWRELVALKPAWKDPEVWERVRTQIVTYLRAAGFTARDFRRLTDPKEILVLYQASQWGEIVGLEKIKAQRNDSAFEKL